MENQVVKKVYNSCWQELTISSDLECSEIHICSPVQNSPRCTDSDVTRDSFIKKEC